MTEPLHRSLFLQGPAGKLEALLWSVPVRRDILPMPPAAIVCHPHPLFGGTMHNKVVYQAAKTLHRFGLPVLRFNFRGVGASEGAHDGGRGEREDASAAIEFMAQEYPGAPLLMAGFSFGSWVGLQAGCGDPRVTELIGMGLPVDTIANREFTYLENCDKPKLLVTGELDPFGPPRELAALVERFSPGAKEQSRIAIVSGADHFFTRKLQDLDRVIAEWLTAQHADLVATEE